MALSGGFRDTDGKALNPRTWLWGKMWPVESAWILSLAPCPTEHGDEERSVAQLMVLGCFQVSLSFQAGFTLFFEWLLATQLGRVVDKGPAISTQRGSAVPGASHRAVEPLMGLPHNLCLPFPMPVPFFLPRGHLAINVLHSISIPESAPRKPNLWNSTSSSIQGGELNT